MGNAGVWGNDPGNGPEDDLCYDLSYNLGRCKKNEMPVKKIASFQIREKHVNEKKLHPFKKDVKHVQKALD